MKMNWIGGKKKLTNYRKGEDLVEGLMSIQLGLVVRTLLFLSPNERRQLEVTPSVFQSTSYIQAAVSRWELYILDGGYLE
jgi:hypothetical protein